MPQFLDTNAPAFNFQYLWEQVQPVLGAVAIFIVGWIIALLVSGGVKKLLAKAKLNNRLEQSTQKTTNVEQVFARIVFWFIFIIAIVAGLNVLDLNSVSAPFSAMISNVVNFIPTLISAGIIALIAWILATVVRTGLNRALAKTSLDEKLSTDVGISSLSKNIAEIAYWLVLLLFLPIILGILGLKGLLAPVEQMVTEAVTFLPNLFIAAVIVFVGFILAKIVRGIIVGLVTSTGLQTQAEKIGLKANNLPSILGSFVFTIIIITALIIAFDALGVETISQPATAMLQQILSAIPNVIAAGLILLIAYIVSKFVAGLIREVLAGVGVDTVPEKLGVQRFLGEKKVSSIVASLIVFFTMLFAVSEAANRLQFANISDLISMFIQFGANILLGAVILVVGFWLANTVANVVKNSSAFLATVVRVLIIGLVLAMGLKAMGIADSIVNLAFGLTLGGAAVAFALAFGLGGRAPAERLLNRLVDKTEKKSDNE